ncbi:hypothetical protein CEXT_621731, partial [Caerostris extrusa]
NLLLGTFLGGAFLVTSLPFSEPWQRHIEKQMPGKMVTFGIPAKQERAK